MADISMRDQFAKAAITGLASECKGGDAAANLTAAKAVAEAAYLLADAMMGIKNTPRRDIK